MRPVTVAEARFILSHVYCVHCVEKRDRGGWIYPWGHGFGEPRCVRCPCDVVADLRLYVASVAEAEEYAEADALAQSAASKTNAYCCEVCDRNLDRTTIATNRTMARAVTAHLASFHP